MHVKSLARLRKSEVGTLRSDLNACNMGTKVRFVHGQGIGAAIYSRYDTHPGSASAKTIQSAPAEHIYEVPRLWRRGHTLAI